MTDETGGETSAEMPAETTEHRAMALVRRVRRREDEGAGRHAAVTDMVTRRVPGRHMHPGLRRD